MDESSPGFGIYVHWPFCAAKCPYCDFNSHVRESVDQSVWMESLCRDLKEQSQLFDGEPVRSVFFGGGTPSLMEPSTVGSILDQISHLWSVDQNVEITLEANPTSVEANRFNGFRSAGINRVSLGVQALNDPDLKALGRFHSADDARNAFNVARKTFDRVSFDLIYARQKQTLADWERELASALDMAIDHLSLYQLTIENGTRFGALHSRGRLRDLPSDDLAIEMYELTADLCADAGFSGYEISSYARDGAMCEHNLIYWRYGTYIGAGPGAHGRVRKDGRLYATSEIRAPEAWLDSVREAGHGLIEMREVEPEDQAEEMMIMGLRLAEGIMISRFESLSGLSINTDKVSELVASGLIETDRDRLRATQKGRQVLNSVLVALLE